MNASPIRPALTGLTASLVALGAGLLVFAPPSAAAPDCPGGRIAPRVLATTGDTLEYGIFDRRGRFFYSDSSTSFLMRIDRFGDAPRRLAAIPAPGAIVFAADGSIIIGTGDSIQSGVMGDMNPMSGLMRVDPDTGAEQTIATGLGMANGIAMGPDGAIYATNDFGFDVDRVLGGKVTHPWARVYSTNGVVVSPDNRYVYVSQTFAPAAIQRISVADPTQVIPYAVAQGADMAAGPDDMTQDERGNLYLAANGAGQVWKIDTSGAICILAGGLMNASAVNFGVGANAGNLYLVGFDGHISELPKVRPTPVPGAPSTSPTSTPPGAGPGPTSRRRAKGHRRARRHRHRHRIRARRRACRDPDRDRDCDRRAEAAAGYGRITS